MTEKGVQQLGLCASAPGGEASIPSEELRYCNPRGAAKTEA